MPYGKGKVFNIGIDWYGTSFLLCIVEQGKCECPTVSLWIFNIIKCLIKEHYSISK